GIGAWKQGHDNEYYGNIVYNNGWDGPARGNGHGTYAQNNTGYKTFEDNIFLNQFGANSRTGGTDAAAVRNISFIGNAFINGRLSWEGPHIENFKVLNNFTYNNRLSVGNEVNSTFVNAEIRDNYAMGGVQLFEFTENLIFKNNTVWNNDPKGKDLVISTINTWNPAKFLIDNNTYYKSFQTKPFWNFAIMHPKRKSELSDDQEYDGGYAFDKTIGSQQAAYKYTDRSWQDDLHIDQNSKYIDSVPDHTRVFLERNKYDSRRARFIIYNWRNLDTIDIDVKSVLNKGDSYELRNVQDYFGDISKGIYQGGRLKITMKGRTLAKPIGYDQFSEWYHDPLKSNTFPTFGVFELIKTAGK
ncbi:MAG: right-handed parallel beta-helix repeat-containing protein, partial [Acidobacteriota bacterium]